MSNYIRSGTEIRVYGSDAVEVFDKLPPGNYTIKEDVYKVLYLERIDDFNVPERLYGRTDFYARRILNTYKDRDSNTGVLLSGEKGSGKTMLARLLAIYGAREGMPTITINYKWTGDRFNRLIQLINQPCILIFDEFEKVYDDQSQNEILTLFDGVYQTKKLIVLTSNDRWAINQHMRNRPGRLYYMLEFKGLDIDFIKEYCEHELNNKAHIPAICRISRMFAEFNFDLLKAMVEELNRYNETPAQVMEMLNAKPSKDEYVQFKVRLFIDEREVPQDRLVTTIWRGIPLGRELSIQYSHTPVNDPTTPAAVDDADDLEGGSNSNIKLVFTDDHLRQVDTLTGNFIYVDQNKRLVLTREQPFVTDYHKLLA